MKYGWIFTMVCLAATISALAWPETPPAEMLRSVMPEADSFKLKAERGTDYFEASKEGTIVGYCIKVDARGYAGPIRMLVGVDTGGAIKGVNVLEHQETAGIGSKICEGPFLWQFNGKNAQEVVDRKGVDAVTGATISSDAVIESVGKTVRQFLSDHPAKLREEEKVRK